MGRREALALAIVVFSILITLNVKQAPTTNLYGVVPPSSQSALVSKIVGKGMGGAVLLVETNKPYWKLPPTFGSEINATLRKYNTYSKMDYFTLKSYIEKKLKEAASQFIMKNFKYIDYLKDLVEQLDGIGLYVYNEVLNAWNIYSLLKNVDQMKDMYYKSWDLVARSVNSYERSFFMKESELSMKEYYYVFVATRLLGKALNVVTAFNMTRKYYVDAYHKLVTLLEKACKEGNLSLRSVAEKLSEGSGYRGMINKLMTEALINAWVSWQGPSPCSSKELLSSFTTAVLTFFVSMAPGALAQVGPQFNLTSTQMKTVVILATTLSPSAPKRAVSDALYEAVRLTLGLSPKTTEYVLKSLSGDEKAFAALVVVLVGVKDPCLARAVFESVYKDVPFSLSASACEVRGIAEILKDAPKPRDPYLTTSVVASRGMNKSLVEYEAFYSTYLALVEKGVTPKDAILLLEGKIVPEKALDDYLKASGALYPECVVEAVSTSKNFLTAQKRAILCVYKQLTKPMLEYGFSKEAIDTMIYSIIAMGPGLSDQQIKEVVFRTVMVELSQIKDPRIELLKNIINLSEFIKKIVWSDSASQAIKAVEPDIKRATANFMKKYVALDLLVGKDGKHLLFMLSEDPGVEPKVPYPSYYVGPKFINEEIRKSTIHDINFLNKVGALAVFLALLVSVRSLRLSLIPVAIIYIVLQYYKLILQALASLGIKPTNVDIVITTATILGMGIDYSLFTVSRYKRGNFFVAIKPVLVAASMASLGFAIFGAVSAFLLPGLKTLGLFVPLAIMFTAVVGPAITVLFKNILKIKEEVKAEKVPLLTAVSADLPKVVMFLSALLVLASIYLLLVKPPGYDLYLFLPKDSEAIRALQALQRYSSPGAVGPTIVVLKIKGNDMHEVAEATESLVRYLLQTGYFNYAFTYTRPLGKFVSTDPKVLDVMGGKEYLKGKYLLVYLLPSYPPDSSKMINYIKELRQFLKKWIAGKPFSEALVGGESAMNYDIANAVNKITLNYVIPIMFLVSVGVYLFLFRRPELVSSASGATLVAMIALLGLTIFAISLVLKLTTLWIVIPLAVTAILSVGSDYSVFYFFGLKASLEECKIVEEGECVHKMNAVFYNAARMWPLILGFALTFSVAYFTLLFSKIWALREIGISLGMAPILLVLSLFTLVPATLAMIWKE